jgi:hypothetical protein
MTPPVPKVSLERPKTVTVNNASRRQIIIIVVTSNVNFQIGRVKTKYHQIVNFGLISNKLHGQEPHIAVFNYW